MYVFLVPVSTHSSDRVRCYMRVIWQNVSAFVSGGCHRSVCARARVYDTTI